MINIEELVARMSIEEKVGNLFMCGFDNVSSNTIITDELRTLIEQYHIGGVIYFSRNIRNPNQVAELSSSIQSLAMNKKYRLPVIISTDQEGGKVVRLKSGSIFPGNMGLGAINSEEITYNVGRIIGTELISLGINMNLAPVLDVNTNPLNPVIGVRSFSSDPAIVSSLGGAFIRGLHSSGVLSVAKHFPGHGDTSLDSHLELPVMDKSLDELMNVHLRPFIDAINIFNVDAIMTAHVVYPVLDKENPATLSKKILTDLLRNKLGFKGVIMTDCMEMKAISDRYSAGDSAIKALKAGADMVLFSHTYKKQVEAYQSVVKAVENGDISDKELNEKVTRVLQLKFRVINFVNKINPSIVGSEEHRAFELYVARKAVTLLKNEKVLPIKNDKNIIIVDSEMTLSSPVEEKYNMLYLSEVLKKFYNNVIDITINKNPNNEDYDKVVKLLKNVHNSVFLMVVSSKEQAELLNRLIPFDGDVVVVFYNPFLINHINTKYVNSIIVGYSNSPCMIVAIGELISGKIKPNGKLPVNLSKPLSTAGNLLGSNNEFGIGSGMKDF
jgi:beta-N-acetylhexosaminidase